MGLLQDFGILTVKKRIELGLTYKQARSDYMTELKYAWKKKNPKKVMRHQAERRERIKLKRPQIWDDMNHKARLARHKLTEEEFQTLRVSQNNHCALCPATRSGRKDHQLHIDHDHKTGRVRGLLCAACNLMLGHFEKDLTWVEKAAKYLKENLT